MSSLSWSLRRALRIAGFAGAAIAIGAFAWALLSPRTPFDQLIAAANELSTRRVEARLSGSFERKPFANRRGGSRPLFDVASAFENSRTRGVAQLLLDQAPAAVDTFGDAILEETSTTDVPSAIARSRDAKLLVDLAAALFTRGRANAPADLVLALEAAERSWLLEHSPQAAWNRALGLEALSLREQALAAWNEYLAIETDAAWAAEGREHLARLQQSSPPERSLGKVRADGEESLERWTRAAAKHDEASAASALAAAESSGAALAKEGDALLSHSVNAIQAARGATRASLIEGHVLYADGRAAATAQQMTIAAEKLRAAEEHLRAGSSDYALRACLYGAMAQYHGGKAAEARATLERCFAEDRLPYPALTADAAWARGLFAAAAGRSSEALPAYQKALDLFLRGREWDNVAALHNQLAILYGLMGDQREAWSHRHQALELYGQHDLPSQRARVLLMDVARTASADGCPLVAIRLQNAIVALAQKDDDPFAISNALQSRARYFDDAGLNPAAVRDIDEAQHAAAGIKDAPVRARAETNVNIARAHIVGRTNPAEACRLLHDTIEHLRRIENPLLLPELYVAMARCQADQRLMRDAGQSIDAALAELRSLNEHSGTTERRRSHLDSQRRVRQSAIELFAEQKDYARAFEVAERFDGQLRPNAFPTPPARDTAVVKYAVLPQQLIAWVVRDGHVTAFATPVSSRALETSLHAFREARADGNPDAAIQALERLHRSLIAPIAKMLPRTVVIVPDDFLAEVPFAALRDEKTDRYFAEEHAFAFARCAACIDWSALRERAIPASSSMLAVGDPWPIARSLPRLPSAEIEARDAAQRSSHASVLTGADATKQRLLAALSTADVLHFAGHAVLNAELPDRSALILANTSADDGELTAGEIAAIDARHLRVVVLSACDSGVGRVSFGGPLSIADAFLRAGTKTVVATLWDADDDEAQQLLQRFHNAIQHGASAVEALHQAQTAMIHDGNSRPRAQWTWASYHIVM